MVKCPVCGGEIKYIPVGYAESAIGTLVVEVDYTEVITDNGRTVKGHLRHKCPDKMNLHGMTDEDIKALRKDD